MPVAGPAKFEIQEMAGTSCIPGAFEFDQLICFPNTPQPASYYYVPRHAQPQRGSDGAPMLNLIAAGATGFLQLTASWDVPGGTLEALRQEIAARDNIEDPATVRLAFAPVQIEGCALLVGDGTGEEEELARSATSGMPPYSALFSVTLNEAQLANAAAAINGRFGFLMIRYAASLAVPVEVVARLSGDATDLARELQERPAMPDGDLQSLIAEALEQGRLAIHLTAPSVASADLQARARDMLLTEATGALRRLAGGEPLGTADLEVTASLVEDMVVALTPAADVADWLQGGAPVTPAPGRDPTDVPPPPPDQAVTLSMGFPAKAAPLALVEVRLGEARALWTPPDFASLRLPGGATTERLQIETSYTSGGVAYRCELARPEHGELALTPDDLGLTMVTVDARPLAAADMQKARIWLRYRPGGGPVVDERTIHFRHRDWQACWFLVTRGQPTAGALEFTWKATTADGRIVDRPMAVATSPNIVLTLGNGED